MSALGTAREQWRTQTRGRPIHPAMALTDDGLVLGGTVLARRSSRSRPRAVELAATDTGDRLRALLSVAYRNPVAPSVLAKIRLAADYSSRGETTVALIALAQTGLPRLPDPEEASFRLF